jgi:hypothetical protein
MFSDTDIEHARSISIMDVLAQRGIRLKGRGRTRWGPCPIHGGVDRFGVGIRRGHEVWHCRKCCCIGGDVIALVQHLDGCDFAIETLIGERRSWRCYSPPPPPVATTPPDSGRWRQIWEEAWPATGSPVESYLAARHVLDLLPVGALDDVLRYHPHCPFGEERLPAMLALIRNIETNAPQGIQRVAIEYDKADGTIKIKGVRRMVLGSWRGGAIKLSDDAEITTALGVGEGIESTAWLRRHPDFPTLPLWALIADRGIEDFPVLPGVDSLAIAVDHDNLDPNTGRRPGQDAAAACSERWTSAGRDVFRVISKTPGEDLNDLAQRVSS